MTRRGIALLGTDALTITQNDPEFSPLVADTLGNEITAGDGWDKEIADLAALFDGGDDLLKAMGDHLIDADFLDGDIDSGLLGPLADGTAQLIKDGEPLFGSMVDAITPPPPPPPPPQGGGVGGDGGGGDGGGGGNSSGCGWAFDPNTDGLVWTCVF